MRLYLDACCLNRLTDDQSQGRIRNEAQAVESILRAVRKGKATWVGSTALEIEISRNPDADRRRGVIALLAFANEVVVPRSRLTERAAFLQTLGFDPFDALHLACAEQGQVDVLPITDDDPIRRAGRRTTKLRTRVCSRVSWYQAVVL